MYISYCRCLRFEEIPDYMYLRQMFRILFRTLNFQYDWAFDWSILNANAKNAALASKSEEKAKAKLSTTTSNAENAEGAAKKN